MPRVNHVKRARKYQGKCGKCGAELMPGGPYRWWKFNSRFGGGGKHKRCMKPGCSPRGSDLTASDKLSQMYSAQEMVEDAMSTGQEALVAALNDAAEQVREVGEEYRESGQNIEDGFGHPTGQSEELQERGDEVTAWGDELENAASEIEGMEADPEDCSTCGGTGEQADDCESCEEGTVDGEECVECDGTGELVLPCADCDGDGEITSEDAEPDREAMDEVATGATDQMP